jgi:hypothetical protein
MAQNVITLAGEQRKVSGRPLPALLGKGKMGHCGMGVASAASAVASTDRALSPEVSARRNCSGQAVDIRAKRLPNPSAWTAAAVVLRRSVAHLSPHRAAQCRATPFPMREAAPDARSGTLSDER